MPDVLDDLNAYRLECLPRLGVDVHRLGCVMLDLLPDEALAGAVPDEWAYHSDTIPHVTGVQTSPHVTLLYGLLHQPVDVDAVTEVLGAWDQPTHLSMTELRVFRSPHPDERYSCIVAAGPLEPGAGCLREAHARLSLLPHINTHARYVPHVTLAYVRQDREDDALAVLRSRMRAGGDVPGVEFTVAGINYGDGGDGRRAP